MYVHARIDPLICPHLLGRASLLRVFIRARAPLRAINCRGIEDVPAKRDVAAFACYLMLFREITPPLHAQKAQDRASTLALSARSLARGPRRVAELFIALNHRSAALGSS